MTWLDNFPISFTKSEIQFRFLSVSNNRKICKDIYCRGIKLQFVSGAVPHHLSFQFNKIWYSGICQYLP